MKIPLKLGGVLAAGAAAVCCGIVLHRKWRENNKARLFQRAVEGIREHAEDFDGLFESLYQSEKNHSYYSVDSYLEWCARVEQSGDEAFAAAFAEFFNAADTETEALAREKFALLLTCIDTAGITRERESERAYIADDMLCAAYVGLGDKKPEPGETYTVVKSAWLSGEKVIEYGMVLPGEYSF